MAIHFGKRGTSEKRIAYANTAADRLALSSPDVDEVVWQRDTETLYRWDGYEWKVGSGLDPATSETALYVDIVAGNDGYTGLVSAPLATIQEAIYRFIPPHLPAPYWARDEVYTINIQYTPGMSAITERIHIPYRRGEGTLRIIAQEEELFTGLTQSGALSQGGANDSDGYYNSHYELTCTTSPFVANSLTDGYFIRPSVNPNEHTIEMMFEQGAIVDNTASSLDIVTYNPGSYLGFGFGNNMDFDVVRPQIEWTFPNDQAFITFVGDSLITCDGGINEISGFRFTAPSNNYARTFIASRAPVASDANQIQNAIMRCTFEAINDRFIVASGNSMSLAGCYFDIQGANSVSIFKQGGGCNIYSSRINHDVSGLSIPIVFEDVRGAQIAGLSYRGNSFLISSNSFGLYIRRTTGLSVVLGLDMRNSRNGLFFFDSVAGATDSSFLDMAGTGIAFSRTSGSANNITASAEDVGFALSESNITMSGCEAFLCDDGIEMTLTSLSLGSSSFYDCPHSGIICIDNCSISVSSGLTGYNNSEYGIELLRTGNSIRVPTATTLTGDLGDTILGRDAGGPVRSWSGGDASNPSTLNILTVF